MKRLLVLLLILTASFALAETISLKSGEKIDGDVSGASKGGAVVDREGVKITVPWDFMDAPAAIAIWESKLNWDDAKGLSDLADFAESHGLDADAKRVWEKVLKADVDNADARAALGFVKQAGEWVKSVADPKTEAPHTGPGDSGPPKDNLVAPEGIEKSAVEHDKKGNEILEDAKQDPKGFVEKAEAAIAEFKEALSRYGKAKLKLKASIVENGSVAVDVTAAFVVTR